VKKLCRKRKGGPHIKVERIPRTGKKFPLSLLAGGGGEKKKKKKGRTGKQWRKEKTRSSATDVRGEKDLSTDSSQKRKREGVGVQPKPQKVCYKGHRKKLWMSSSRPNGGKKRRGLVVALGGEERKIDLGEKEGGTGDFLFATDQKGLVVMAQKGEPRI